MIKRWRLVTVTRSPQPSRLAKDIRSVFQSTSDLPKPGQKTVTMSGKVLKELEERYESEKKVRPNLSFASFISESALIELERKNMLREAQFISVVGFNDNMLTLKDARKNNRFFEVQIRNRKLRCITDDNSPDCAHVGFALALPEVRKALNR